MVYGQYSGVQCFESVLKYEISVLQWVPGENRKLSDPFSYESLFKDQALRCKD